MGPGAPLTWTKKHQLVEGETAQAAELGDLGLRLCSTASWTVTWEKSLNFF